MSHASMAADRAELLRLQRMLRRRIDELVARLAALEEELALVDTKLEVTE